MAVSHRHCQRLVAEQLTYGADVYPGHYQSTCEGVSEAMPREALYPCIFQRGLEPAPGTDQGSPIPAPTGEYVLTAIGPREKVSKGRGSDGVDWDVASGPILRLGQCDDSAFEIYLGPLEAELLTCPHAGIQRDIQSRHLGRTALQDDAAQTLPLLVALLCSSASSHRLSKVTLLRNCSGSFFCWRVSVRRLSIKVLASDRLPAFSR